MKFWTISGGECTFNIWWTGRGTALRKDHDILMTFLTRFKHPEQSAPRPHGGPHRRTPEGVPRRGGSVTMPPAGHRTDQQWELFMDLPHNRYVKCYAKYLPSHLLILCAWFSRDLTIALFTSFPLFVYSTDWLFWFFYWCLFSDHAIVFWFGFLLCSLLNSTFGFCTSCFWLIITPVYYTISCASNTKISILIPYNQNYLFPIQDYTVWWKITNRTHS